MIKNYKKLLAVFFYSIAGNCFANSKSKIKIVNISSRPMEVNYGRVNGFFKRWIDRDTITLVPSQSIEVEQDFDQEFSVAAERMLNMHEADASINEYFSEMKTVVMTVSAFGINMIITNEISREIIGKFNQLIFSEFIEKQTSKKKFNVEKTLDEFVTHLTNIYDDLSDKDQEIINLVQKVIPKIKEKPYLDKILSTEALLELIVQQCIVESIIKCVGDQGNEWFIQFLEKYPEYLDILKDSKFLHIAWDTLEYYGPKVKEYLSDSPKLIGFKVAKSAVLGLGFYTYFSNQKKAKKSIVFHTGKSKDYSINDRYTEVYIKDYGNKSLQITSVTIYR